MSSNLPRVPMTLLYPELFKSQSGSAVGSTDYRSSESVPKIELEPEYRAPTHELYRDQLFRRYPNGNLDLPAAIMLVLDVVYRMKAGGPLNDQECLIISACFPHAAEGRVPQFDGRSAKSEARSRFRLSDNEVAAISMGVAHTLAAQHEHVLLGFKG